MDILIAVLGSGGFFSFLTYLLARHDKLTRMAKQLAKLERDGCRTQMLVLMSDYPQEKAELLTLAEHYFCDLGGNWYMTSIFKDWLDNNGMQHPTWFDPSRDGNR